MISLYMAQSENNMSWACKMIYTVKKSNTAGFIYGC